MFKVYEIFLCLLFVCLPVLPDVKQLSCVVFCTIFGTKQANHSRKLVEGILTLFADISVK